MFRVGAAYLVFGWLLLQVTNVLGDALDLPAWLPKLMVALLAVGIVPTLIVAWIYELTPGGLRRDSEVDHSAGVTHATARKLDIAVIVLLACAIGFLALDRLVLAPRAGAPAPARTAAIAGEPITLAVLPFANMSADADNAFFADGVAEEVLNVLARIPQLRVAARTSSFQFKGQNRDVAEIALMLKVGHVIEGSVRRQGDRVRVTVQLVDPAQGFRIWSETYDREVTDIFAIQDEIANRIAEALKVELALEPDASGNLTGTENLEAYERYMLGTQHLHKRTDADLALAVGQFEAAIAADPRFARAYAGLAMTYVVRPIYSAFPPSEAHRLARDAAGRALALDPNQPDATLALAYISINEFQWSEAERLILQVLRDNPSHTTALHWYGLSLLDIGRFEEASARIDEALKLDPTARATAMTRSMVLIAQQRWAEAQAQTEAVLAHSPAFSFALQFDAYDAVRRGDAARFAKRLREIAALKGGSALPFAERMLAAVETGAARAEAIAEIAALPPGSRFDPAIANPFEEGLLVLLLVRMDAHEQAVLLLRRAVDARHPTWSFVFRSAPIDALYCRADFQALLDDARLPANARPGSCATR